jgi:hypothetical protein
VNATGRSFSLLHRLSRESDFTHLLKYMSSCRQIQFGTFGEQGVFRRDNGKRRDCRQSCPVKNGRNGRRKSARGELPSHPEVRAARDGDAFLESMFDSAAEFAPQALKDEEWLAFVKDIAARGKRRKGGSYAATSRPGERWTRCRREALHRGWRWSKMESERRGGGLFRLDWSGNGAGRVR